MTGTEEARQLVAEPLASLERQLIATFVAAAGFDIHELWQRHDDEALALLVAASRHASEVLSEIEARGHYLKRLHGDE